MLRYIPANKNSPSYSARLFSRRWLRTGTEMDLLMGQQASPQTTGLPLTYQIPLRNEIRDVIGPSSHVADFSIKSTSSPCSTIIHVLPRPPLLPNASSCVQTKATCLPVSAYLPHLRNLVVDFIPLGLKIAFADSTVDGIDSHRPVPPRDPADHGSLYLRLFPPASSATAPPPSPACAPPAPPLF